MAHVWGKWEEGEAGQDQVMSVNDGCVAGGLIINVWLMTCVECAIALWRIKVSSEWDGQEESEE